MIFATITGLLTGIAFGLVLFKVGATRYSRVMGMLTLRDTKIMKFAFTTIAVGSVIYGLASLSGVAATTGIETRVMPFLGWAHVLGGVLFGSAMAFTGLCPGTCAAKAGGRGGEKRFAGLTAILGLIVGVVLYAWLKQPLMDAGIIAERPRNLTLHGFLGLPYGVVAVVLGAALLAIVLLVDRFTPEMRYAPAREKSTLWDWIRGEWSFLASGTVAALLIVASSMQGYYLGFSGSLLALVGAIGHGIGMPLSAVPEVSEGIAWRAALISGALVGGLAASLFSTFSKGFVGLGRREDTIDFKALGVVGGGTAVMALGAMIGGGCTTGAFLSAWPTLSMGSFAMALTFFATSMAVSNARIWLRDLDMRAAQEVGEQVYD